MDAEYQSIKLKNMLAPAFLQHLIDQYVHGHSPVGGETADLQSVAKSIEQYAEEARVSPSLVKSARNGHRDLHNTAIKIIFPLLKQPSFRPMVLGLLDTILLDWTVVTPIVAGADPYDVELRTPLSRQFGQWLIALTSEQALTGDWAVPLDQRMLFIQCVERMLDRLAYDWSETASYIRGQLVYCLARTGDVRYRAWLRELARRTAARYVATTFELHSIAIGLAFLGDDEFLSRMLRDARNHEVLSLQNVARETQWFGDRQITNAAETCCEKSLLTAKWGDDGITIYGLGQDLCLEEPRIPLIVHTLDSVLTFKGTSPLKRDRQKTEELRKQLGHIEGTSVLDRCGRTELDRILWAVDSALAT